MPRKMREMVGGCCVCSDERGWDENPLVYCDGQGCNVAVHQACYGIVTVPTGPWFCRKCESQERAARVRCELCPNKDGGLKRTDTNSWAHVVCALYIPEVRFGNVSTMEPIVLGLVPQERYQKVCYLCENQGRESRASSGACMQCNKSGCKSSFHVTCAQRAGLLCEEAGNYSDNVKYCGYCEYHYQRIVSRLNKKVVKTVPAFKPVPSREGSGESDSGGDSSDSDNKDKKNRKSNRKSLGGSSTGSGPGNNLGSNPASDPKPESKNGVMASSDPKPCPAGGNAKTPTTPTSKESSFNSSESSTPDTKDAPDPKCVPTSTEANPDSYSSAPKQPSVIVKFGKQDGTYYSKKDTSSPTHTGSTNGSTTSAVSTAAATTSSVSISTANSINNSDAKKDIRKEKLKRSREEAGLKDGSEAKKQPVDLTDKKPDKHKADSVKRPNGSTEKHHHHHHPDKKADEKKKEVKTPECIVSLDKSKVDNMRLNSQVSMTTMTASSKLTQPSSSSSSSTAAAAAVAASDNRVKASGASAAANLLSSASVTPSTSSPIELKKDSPAKILPISASSSTTPPSGTFGKPLKVEVSNSAHSSANPSRSSSLEVSPVKVDNKPMTRDFSPPRVTQDVKLGNSQGSKRTAPSGKRLGRPPKKGTHMHTNSLGASGLSPTKGDSKKRSPTSSPDRDDHEEGFVKRQKKSAKRLTNGDGKLWMMGASLNPSSEMAKEMDSVLKSEIRAHSAYDITAQPNYHGVPLPGSKRSRAAQKSSASSTTTNSSQESSKSCQPQTLDELLERQWEQGSQFLMDQASHFDIASLLSSLHQLKEENLELEDSVDKMVQRRDHLLAVRARLLALSSLTVTNPTSAAAAVSVTGKGAPATATSSSVPNGPNAGSGGAAASRASVHVSPRNQAGSSSVATVSPIRTASAMLPARGLPAPPPSSSGVNVLPASSSVHMQPLPPPAHSPRDRHGPLPQSHQMPSPRERPHPPPESSPRQFPAALPPSPRESPRMMHMENGIDFHHHGTPPGAIPVSSPTNLRQGPSPSAHEGTNRSGVPAHLLAVAGGPPPGHLPPPPPSHMQQGRPSAVSHSALPPPRQSAYGGGQPPSSMMSMQPRSSPHQMPASGMTIHPHHGSQRPPIVSSQVSVGPPPSHHGGPPRSAHNMMVRHGMDGRPPYVRGTGGGGSYGGHHGMSGVPPTSSMNLSASHQQQMMHPQQRQGSHGGPRIPLTASMHHDKR